MKRRALLRVAVKGALLAGVIAFAGVFVYGLFGPLAPSGPLIELGGIPPGTARLASWDGTPVWVVSRSEKQVEALEALSAHVGLPAPGAAPAVANRHRSRDPVYGVFLAETRRSGILVQYTRDRPRGLASGIPWHGGFVDPGSDAVFDVAGRRYRTTEGAPLAVPPHRVEDANTLRLGAW